MIILHPVSKDINQIFETGFKIMRKNHCDEDIFEHIKITVKMFLQTLQKTIPTITSKEQTELATKISLKL